MSVTEDVEDMESRCWRMLAEEKKSQVLEELCTAFGLTIPPATSGKRNLLYKLLIKYLNSDPIQESDDQGLSTFLKLNELHTIAKVAPDDVTVEQVPDQEKTVKVTAVKKETDVQGMEDKMASSYFDIQKMKELKINGKIGGVGEKDKLSYISLSYQISNAKKMGYSDERICGAVIKAITPGSHLRTYLESKRTVTLPSLIEVMRSHFREKDSTSIFSELSNAVQAANESCLDFIIRVMCLREKVVSLSVEEGCPYDVHLVSQRFSHTILTGLRNNNIRNELRYFLKQSFSDEELLKVVTEAVANELEHSEKTEKKIVKIQSVVAENSIEKNKKEKDTPLPKQIQELRCDMSTMRSELQEIKALLQNDAKAERKNQNERRNQNFAPRYKQFRKCQTCYANNVQCFHCFHCGSAEHRVANCPVASSGN